MASKSPTPKRTGSHIRKYEVWVSSPAYRDLSCPARCLLDEFQRIYRKGRNGRLVISQRQAAELLGVHKNTATKAFDELVEHGFLALSKGERWQENKAREWRLTIEGTDGHAPTDDWANWKPGKPVATLPKKQPNRPNSGCAVFQFPEA